MNVQWIKIFVVILFFFILIFVYLYYKKSSENKELILLLNKKNNIIKHLEKENIYLENKIYVLELSLKDSILYKIIEDNKDKLKEAKEFFK